MQRLDGSCAKQHGRRDFRYDITVFVVLIIFEKRGPKSHTVFDFV